MKTKAFIMIVAALCCYGLAFSQVATRSGSIYGRVLDEARAPLPGVLVTLEGAGMPAITANSGPSGGFRFANLPPGTYSVTFAMDGFTEIRQEEVRVTTGAEVQLEMTLRASLSEEFTVIGETPVVDTKNTSGGQLFAREHLHDVPSGRDPWVISDQTTGVDSDRYNVAGSESGQQASFLARGGNDDQNVWNYDGINISDTAALGGSTAYFDFDSFEEIQITTAGSDVSMPTGGVSINIVTKRPGNKVEGNGSFYFVNDSLQGDNTPEELQAQGITKSNRLDEVKDFGFDLGGPILKDRLFAWGAYHKYEIGLFTVSGLKDFTELKQVNLKTTFNWNQSHESQFTYFNDDKIKQGRAAVNPAIQAPETLWTQGGSETILEGIWAGTHTWIPNDRLLVTGRYGYIGSGFSLVPQGGRDVPMIYLDAIPRYEQTIYYIAPIDRPTHDLNVEANYYRENLLGGDHEFRFGFEYKHSSIHSFSSYGNGLYITDFVQATPGGPLVEGDLALIHYIDGTIKLERTSMYLSDTYRKDRLTLNLGFRFDHNTGSNEAASIPGLPGFEDVVGPLQFEGGEGPSFSDFSPRFGITYDLSGDGKTVLRGNVARYVDNYDPAYPQSTNPTYTLNGALLHYVNRNGDREVTSDEVVGDPIYFGGLSGPDFDVNEFLSKNLYDPDFHNSSAMEYLIGFERQLGRDIAVSAMFTHRDYSDLIAQVPLGLATEDFVPAGTFEANTVLGSFSVPLYTLPLNHDGTLIYRNIQGLKRRYNGVDLNVRKRMSHNFMVNAGLTLQSQKADYKGSDALGFVADDAGLSGQMFPFDPTNLQFLNGNTYAYGPTASGKSGVYPFSEWNFKLSGAYQFPHDVSVGAFLRYQQGYPYVLFGGTSDSTLAAALGTGTKRFMVEPFGSRRFDNLFTLDLQMEKAFDMGNYGRLSLSAGLFNATNANTVIRRNRSVTSTTLSSIEENLSPRALRLGVRYNF